MKHNYKFSSASFIIITWTVIMFVSGCKGDGRDGVSTPGSKKDADINALYTGYYKNPTTLDERQQNEIIDYAAEKNLPLLRLESGVYYMITEKGRGPTLRWGEKIRVDYKGYYLDGREFDSSYKRGTSYTTAVGQSIAGWNDALLRMRSGTKATIILPSRLGYKDQEFAGIPPNSIIAFDIHIII